jgi:hypothetical protein
LLAIDPMRRLLFMLDLPFIGYCIKYWSGRVQNAALVRQYIWEPSFCGLGSFVSTDGEQLSCVKKALRFRSAMQAIDALSKPPR